MARYPKELSAEPSDVKYPDGTIKLLSELTPEEFKNLQESIKEHSSQTVKAIMMRDPEKNIPIWSKYFETSYV